MERTKRYPKVPKGNPYRDSQRPLAPHGSTRPLEDTGRADFLCHNFSMESFHFRAKEIRKHGRLQSCGIGIDQEEKRIVRKDLW